MKHYKYVVAYTDGGYRQYEGVDGTGAGIHGYAFNDLPTVRLSGVPVIVTPEGYKDKPTGVQLKDTKYNPTYEHFGIKTPLKVNDKAPVGKEWEAIVFDSWGSYGTGVTAQKAELLAFINLMEGNEFTFDEVLVYSDSQYFVTGFNTQLVKWVRDDWRLSDGSEVKNLPEWKAILAIKERYVDKLTVRKIKAHVGEFGNELADRNATYGIAGGMNGCVDVKWVITDFMDKEYWEPSKTINELLRLKWVYDLVGRDLTEWEVNGEIHYQYFFGDHGTEMELLGAQDPEALLGVALLKQREPILDKLKEYHREVMWGNTNRQYRYDPMQLIHVNNLIKPKVMWESKNVGLDRLWLRNERNEVQTINGSVISYMQRPPRLSYRALEEEEYLLKVLRATLLKIGFTFNKPGNTDKPLPFEVTVEDVTDKFYTKDKMTDFYDHVATSVKLKMANPITDHTDVILTRGTHLPPRNLMASLVTYNPKVYTVAWRFSANTFRYALVINTDDGVSIWSGVYCNHRILIDGK